MKISKKFNDIAYFIMSYHYQFLGSAINATFSNLKVNVFIITDFICSKYVKQLVLINDS